MQNIDKVWWNHRILMWGGVGAGRNACSHSPLHAWTHGNATPLYLITAWETLHKIKGEITQFLLLPSKP